MKRILNAVSFYVRLCRRDGVSVVVLTLRLARLRRQAAAIDQMWLDAHAMHEQHRQNLLLLKGELALHRHGIERRIRNLAVPQEAR